MEDSLSGILRYLPVIDAEIRKFKELILSNLVMFAEIPAPTFREDRRLEFLVNRFTQSQLINCSTDEMGNGLGILPGEQEDRNILISAHMDSVHDESVDHTCSVQPDYVAAPGVGDNALGLAAIASLPDIINALDIKLQSNLILMGSSRSLGRGNTEGMRFFLRNSKLPICAGLCVEGIQLGRLSYSSLGMTRCEVSYSIPEDFDWTRFGAAGSISTMNEYINKVMAIPLPSRPKTSIVFNSIEGGKSLEDVAGSAILRLEINSEDGEMVKALRGKIKDIAAEVAAETGETVNVEIISQTDAGGLEYSHPLVSTVRAVMAQLNIKPWIKPSTGELAAFTALGIPALTLGISRGESKGSLAEVVEIAPIYTGIAQLLGIILAIDRGFCDGE